MASPSNRQKKILRFFEVPFSPRISEGAAGLEVAALMESEANRERWRRYVYLTKDFDKSWTSSSIAASAGSTS